MYYILMHQNTQVAYCKDDKVLKILRKELLPIGTIFKKKQCNLKNWLLKRCIPKTRTNYIEIKEFLEGHFSNTEQYAFNNYGVSLNDCYWFYEVPSSFHFYLFKKSKFSSKIPDYKNIKLYNIKEIEDGFLQHVAENKSIDATKINSKLPDNVTGGNTTKFWTMRNGEFYLVKQNHPSQNKVAEKIIASQIVCDIINNTRHDLNEKKPDIETANYFYETGNQPINSCCYSKCFTDENHGITTYAAIEHTLGKSMSIEEMIEHINPSSEYLKEFFDFLILFDYLTENKRTKDDINFIINNSSNRIIRPAPLSDFSNTFDYMDKDYERIYKKDNIGNYINVFEMTPEEQIDYIANISWIDNRELFANFSELQEYFESNADTRQLTLANLETICNVINHKLYHIEKRKYEIAEAEGLLEEFGFGTDEEYY